MRFASMIALCLLGVACSSGEPVSANAPDAEEISHDELLKLPGWRNEGALPVRGPEAVAPEPAGTYYAWSLDLHGDADIMLRTEGRDARLRVLAQSERRWQLVASADASRPLEHQLPAGHYMVVVQPDASRDEAWSLSAACYGGGCPAPSPR
jgi:hypothetical protein